MIGEMKSFLSKVMIMALALGIVNEVYARNVDIIRLQERLDSVMTSHYSPSAPGAALLVAKEGNILYDKGVGIADMETGEKIDGNTAFNIASISKQFTAIGALKMQEMGLINLEHSVARYFPEMESDQWKKVRLRHLLSHSSGVPDARPRDDRNFMLFATDEQSVSYMTALKDFHFEPGTSYEYINPTFDLFYFITEKVTGMRFVDFQKKYIFDKAGMKNVQYFTPDAVIPHMAHGYIVNEDAVVSGADSDYAKKREKVACDYVDGNGVHWAECDYGEETFFATKADGGIYTTTHDFLRWEKALASNLLVKEASKIKAYTPHTMVTGSPWSGYQNRPYTWYGYGWFIDKTPGREVKIYHTGDNGGFQAYAAKYEQSAVNVIMLENQNTVDRWTLQLLIEKILLEEGVLESLGGI